MGSSGCGKSTLLNLIAGFFPQSTGTLSVYEKPVTGTGIERAMVFQNADSALFSWLTVAENVEFGLRMRGLPAPERRQRSQYFIDLVGLRGHETKKTIVFVTHDISEAILLGQRIVILAAQPASGIEAFYTVDLAYPRDMSAGSFGMMQALVAAHFDEGGGI